MMTHNVYSCISCDTGKSGFKFCSGICDLPEDEALIKLRNKEIQFINDNHDSDLFCKLSNSNKNLFNFYYTGEDDFSEIPFNLPIIKISKIKKQ